MADFLIGCTHFGHANIIGLAKRPFSDLAEMEEALVENWNRAVNKRDTVYHLGDFAFKGKALAEYEARLNGTLIRIQGNHDPKTWGTPYLELRENRTKIVLFHYPIEEWNGWFNGAVHFHCHTHDPVFKSAERRGNVGADAIGFTPIRLTEAIARLRD